MPMRNVLVAAAANPSATIGANGASTKWSGMNSVEYPRPSSLRACSAHPAPVRAPDACTPNRNLRVMWSHSRGAEAEGVAVGDIERVDRLPLDLLDALDHQLRDAIAPLDGERRGRIGVDQEHLELTAVLRIDQPRRVEARDAVLEGESRAGQHEARVTCGYRDREAGRDERTATARCELDAFARVQVVAGVVGVLLARERELGIEPLDADLHRHQSPKSPASSARCASVSSTQTLYSGWSTTSRAGPAASSSRCAASNGKWR